MEPCQRSRSDERDDRRNCVNGNPNPRELSRDGRLDGERDGASGSSGRWVGCSQGEGQGQSGHSRGKDQSSHRTAEGADCPAYSRRDCRSRSSGRRPGTATKMEIGPPPLGDMLGDEVYIFYWDERDGPAQHGWWFGPEVGGNEVWCYHPSNQANSPPATEWNVPHDGDIDPTFSISIAVRAPRGNGEPRVKTSHRLLDANIQVSPCVDKHVSERIMGEYEPWSLHHGKVVFRKLKPRSDSVTNMLSLMELRQPQKKLKSMICAEYTEGYCRRGDNCYCAHQLKDLKPGGFKPKLCVQFSQSGVCPRAGQCFYAHGQSELPPSYNQPQPSRTPTPGFASRAHSTSASDAAAAAAATAAAAHQAAAMASRAASKVPFMPLMRAEGPNKMQLAPLSEVASAMAAAELAGGIAVCARGTSNGGAGAMVASLGKGDARAGPIGEASGVAVGPIDAATIQHMQQVEKPLGQPAALGSRVALASIDQEVQLCLDFMLGQCHMGTACSFSHGDSDFKNQGDDVPESISQQLKTEDPQPCFDFMMGHCQRGRGCPLSHGDARHNPSFVAPQQQWRDDQKGQDHMGRQEFDALDREPRRQDFSGWGKMPSAEATFGDITIASLGNSSDFDASLLPEPDAELVRMLEEQQLQWPASLPGSAVQNSLPSTNPSQTLQGGRGTQLKKWCWDFMQGECKRGDICGFVHGDQFKSKMCMLFVNGSCDKAHECPNAHDHKELPPGFKATLCAYFAQGSCKRKETCLFAHGEEELAIYAPDVAAVALKTGVLPASGGGFKSKLCRNYPNCNRGARCTFAHGEGELQAYALGAYMSQSG